MNSAWDRISIHAFNSIALKDLEDKAQSAWLTSCFDHCYWHFI